MTGRLGSWEIYANVPQAVYVCDKTEATVVVVNICNRNNVPALIRIAVSASATSPANADYIEYDVELAPKGVLERTGVTVSPGQYIVVISSIKAVSAVCWGPTIGDEYPATPISIAPTWSTTSPLTVYAGEATSQQLLAVDPKGTSVISYSLGVGAVLPPGTSISSDGLLSGTVGTSDYVTEGVTTIATVNATDGTAITPRTFSIIRRWRDGLSQNNAAPSAQYIKSLTGTTTSASYWIQHPDGFTNPYQVFCDMSILSGGWTLASGHTNAQGDQTNWWEGDSSFGGAAVGVDWWIAGTGFNLRPDYGTALNKQNFRMPAWTSRSFNQMMIREDFNGSVRYKAYQLNATRTLLQWFSAAFATSSSAPYISDVTSVLGTAGDAMPQGSSAFSSSTLMFNYQLLNDGARLASAAAISEATPGLSSRVDGNRNYTWKGNVLRDDAGRVYSSDGTTVDHSIWLFVR